MIKYITHKGQKILFLDYSVVKTHEQGMNALATETRVVKQEALKHGPILILTNMEGCYYNPTLAKECIEMTKVLKPYVKAEAVYGMNALQVMIFNTVVRVSGRNFYAAKSKEDGLRWLLEQK